MKRMQTYENVDAQKTNMRKYEYCKKAKCNNEHIGNLKNVHKVSAGSKSQTREEVSIKYLYKY